MGTTHAKPTDAERHAKLVRQITEDLLQQAQPILDDIARTLADTPDERLFGDNEFLLRDKILKLVAVALNSRIAQKKTDTTAAASTAPTATPPPDSKATANAAHSDSEAKSTVPERTTTAARAAKASRPGTKKSD